MSEQSYGEHLDHIRRRGLITRLVNRRSFARVKSTSAQDDADRFPGQILDPGGAGEHLGVDIEGSETSDNEMACLASEVEDEKSLHETELLDSPARGCTHWSLTSKVL